LGIDKYFRPVSLPVISKRMCFSMAIYLTIHRFKNIGLLLSGAVFAIAQWLPVQGQVIYLASAHARIKNRAFLQINIKDSTLRSLVSQKDVLQGENEDKKYVPKNAEFTIHSTIYNNEKKTILNYLSHIQINAGNLIKPNFRDSLIFLRRISPDFIDGPRIQYLSTESWWRYSFPAITAQSPSTFVDRLRMDNYNLKPQQEIYHFSVK
jgi:hypothetical protein